MKAFYLVLSIVFTVLILILAFGNINAQCSNLYFLFFPVRETPTIIFLTIALIGVFTGVCYHAFLVRAFDSSDDEEDADF